MSRFARVVLSAVFAIGLLADVANAQGGADLRLTKTASGTTVRVGETVTYTITLTNLGPDAATDVVFGDPLPDQLNLVSSTCGSVSAFCTVTSLASGASVTLTVLATPITNAAQSERRVTNCAFIAEAGSTDPNPDNDIACETVHIVGRL